MSPIPNCESLPCILLPGTCHVTMPTVRQAGKCGPGEARGSWHSLSLPQPGVAVTALWVLILLSLTSTLR